MSIFLVTFAAFGIALAAMSVGVIFSNRRIKGSCGGLSSFKDSSGKSICEGCTDPSPTCSRTEEEQEAHAHEESGKKCQS